MSQKLASDAAVAALGQSVFRLVLDVDSANQARRLRSLIARRRGELKWLSAPPAGQSPCRLHACLGSRRIDDVVAALEAAGFRVAAVVATREA